MQISHLLGHADTFQCVELGCVSIASSMSVRMAFCQFESCHFLASGKFLQVGGQILSLCFFASDCFENLNVIEKKYPYVYILNECKFLSRRQWTCKAVQTMDSGWKSFALTIAHASYFAGNFAQSTFIQLIFEAGEVS